MRYVLLAYGDEPLLDAMSCSERDALTNACQDNNEALQKSGHVMAIEGLQSSRSAITVRVQNGKLSISDGPYAKTKEQLIEIFIINARDLNEAIQVAAKMPQARSGPIEVRPIVASDQT